MRPAMPATGRTLLPGDPIWLVRSLVTGKRGLTTRRTAHQVSVIERPRETSARGRVQVQTDELAGSTWRWTGQRTGTADREPGWASLWLMKLCQVQVDIDGRRLAGLVIGKRCAAKLSSN